MSEFRSNNVAPIPAPTSWNCIACTYTNRADYTICEICFADRFKPAPNVYQPPPKVKTYQYAITQLEEILEGCLPRKFSGVVVRLIAELASIPFFFLTNPRGKYVEVTDQNTVAMCNCPDHHASTCLLSHEIDATEVGLHQWQFKLLKYRSDGHVCMGLVLKDSGTNLNTYGLDNFYERKTSLGEFKAVAIYDREFGASAGLFRKKRQFEIFQRNNMHRDMKSGDRVLFSIERKPKWNAAKLQVFLVDHQGGFEGKLACAELEDGVYIPALSFYGDQDCIKIELYGTGMSAIQRLKLSYSDFSFDEPPTFRYKKG